MSTVDYTILSQQPSDYITGKLEQVHVDTPWYLVNFLPLPVKLCIKRLQTLILLREMPPRSQARIAPGSIQQGDVLHVFTSPEGKDGPDYEIMRPATLRLTARVIRIGDVTYSDVHSGSRFTASGPDINSVRIHNRLTIPLSVFYNGGRIARVNGDDGLGYMAGSTNNVYVTNAGWGFKLGDEITFVMDFNKSKYVTATLTDNYTTDIYVGMITQDTQVPYPDIASYNI